VSSAGRRPKSKQEFIEGLKQQVRRVSGPNPEMVDPWFRDLASKRLGIEVAWYDAPHRRPPGRPRWTEQRFFAVYRDARDRCSEGAPDKELAAAALPPLTPDWFRKLVRRFGRPD
jgi:hypothetical protein